MRVLFDTNIILDIALSRDPWIQDSRALQQACDVELLDPFVSASTVTDIYYIARKTSGPATARKAVQMCLDSIVEVQRAFDLNSTDFEDDLQLACAERFNLDAIVTRDAAGFKNSSIPILAPGELLARISQP
jgi:predicted nucleic acid-binding protein